ncbi:MAG: hypothetical protein JSU72_07920, partial [Deltaproteobacteria bacterium]
ERLDLSSSTGLAECGDRGGFRRAKHSLNSIEPSQLVMRQKLQFACLRAYGAGHPATALLAPGWPVRPATSSARSRPVYGLDLSWAPLFFNWVGIKGSGRESLNFGKWYQRVGILKGGDAHEG